MNEPFQNELRQISVKNLLEGGREALSYSAAALSQQTKAAVAAVTRTTQWGTTRLFHHNERRLIFGGPMGHRSLMRRRRRRQRCKNPTMHSLVGGREIAISTGLSCSGQMGALGLKRGLKQRWKRGLHAYPNREEIYSLLKGSRALEKCAVAEMEAVNYMRVGSMHGGLEADFSCEPFPSKEEPKVFPHTKVQVAHITEHFDSNGQCKCLFG